MKKLILFLLGIFLIGSVFAVGEELYFEPNTTIDLKIYCFDGNGNWCDSATTCQITSFYPNGSRFFFNKSMSLYGNYYNYTQTGNNILGVYSTVAYCLNGSGSTDYESFDYYIGRPSTSIQQATITRGIYLLGGIAILLFILFLFIKQPTLKWTFFLFAFLFITITMNVASISLRNEAANENIRNIFDKIGSLSYIMYYLIGGLVAFLWIFSIFNTLSSKQTMRQAEQVGDVKNYEWLGK